MEAGYYTDSQDPRFDLQYSSEKLTYKNKTCSYFSQIP